MHSRITSFSLMLIIALAPIDVATSTEAAESAPDGNLTKPDGRGPFPAVVLMHDGSEMEPAWGAVWAARLRSWGYVAFEVDSFGPRGVSNICHSNTDPAPQAQSQDAPAAKDYLRTLAYVARKRIGVMGMSGGGEAAIRAVQNSYINDEVRDDPFGAAVALYPHCERQLYRVDAPILVLVGGRDDWTRAGSCRRLAIDSESKFAVQVYVHENATHAFDMELSRRTYFGHEMWYDSAATQDAAARVRAFFGSHLQ